MQSDRSTETGSSEIQTLNPAPVTHEVPQLTPSIAATAPGQLKVIKRNGTVVPYTDDQDCRRA